MDFQTLKEALDFKRTCPYCKSKLEIRSKVHVGKEMKERMPEVRDGKIFFEDIGYAKISIEIDSGRIENSDSNEIYGTYFRGLRIECMSCSRYYHVLNLTFDLGRCRLSQCAINNVYVKSIIGKYQYLLKTSKTFDECVLTKIKLYDEPFPASEDSLDYSSAVPKDIVFPYVEIDLDDPDKTITRLNNLYLFT